MKNLLSLAVIGFFLVSFTVLTTNSINHKISDDFSITINGTSNLHDWVSNVEKVEGNATVKYSESGEVKIENCQLSIPVTSIISSKGSIMNKKTWKALKSDTYPNIKYKMTSFDDMRKAGNTFTAYVKGNLEIGGKSNSIYMKINGKELGNGNIEISGSKSLKMTDFNIDPPTALMGTMTTGNEITIDFKVVLKS